MFLAVVAVWGGRAEARARRFGAAVAGPGPRCSRLSRARHLRAPPQAPAHPACVGKKLKGHLPLKWWAPFLSRCPQAELSISHAVYWVSPAGLWGEKRMLNDAIRLQSNKKRRGNWQQFSEPVRWPVNLLPPALSRGRKKRNQKICRMEKNLTYLRPGQLVDIPLVKREGFLSNPVCVQSDCYSIWWV